MHLVLACHVFTLDIFSRYIVGWQVAARESAAVAQELIKACCAQQRVTRDQLTIHADRGSPMTAKSTALLYVDLGIAKTTVGRIRRTTTRTPSRTSAR